MTEQRRVLGFVEDAGDRIVGWAFAPDAPETRVAVELQLDGRAVAHATADQLRSDLVQNGVGDGHHAFSIDVPEALRPRAAELRVLARAGGHAVPLAAVPPPLAADAVAGELERLRRGMEAVIGSQRMLHRTLQAHLTDRSAAPAECEHTHAQTRIADQIATLEVFVTRLDERLAALAPPPSAPRGPLLPAAFALSTLALIASLAGLIHALPG